MDRELWIVVSCAVRIAVRRLPKARRRFHYSDATVLLMWLWFAWKDRPRCWACDRSNYSSLFRPRALPSVSQFSKRLKSARFELARRLLHAVLVEQGQQDVLSYFDGKALTVGEYSTDADAADGIANGRYRKGYKLHARSTESVFFAEYAVRPLNVGEPNTARELLERSPSGGVALADANYDSALLYAAVAERGGKLLTRLKGRARSHDRLHAMHPARREAIETWDAQPSMCERVMHRRDDIERHFAHLTNCGGGIDDFGRGARLRRTPAPDATRRAPTLQRHSRWHGQALNSVMGGQVQMRLRSPKGLSMRATAGQNLLRRSQGAALGYAACSRG